MGELRSIIPYFRPYRAGFFAGIVCVVFANAFQIAVPYLTKLAIDALEDPSVTSGRIALLAGLIVSVRAAHQEHSGSQRDQQSESVRSLHRFPPNVPFPWSNSTRCKLSVGAAYHLAARQVVQREEKAYRIVPFSNRRWIPDGNAAGKGNLAGHVEGG